jgi:hypothetical protein
MMRRLAVLVALGLAVAVPAVAQTEPARRRDSPASLAAAVSVGGGAASTFRHCSSFDPESGCQQGK